MAMHFVKSPLSSLPSDETVKTEGENSSSSPEDEIEGKADASLSDSVSVEKEESPSAPSEGDTPILLNLLQKQGKSQKKRKNLIHSH